MFSAIPLVVYTHLGIEQGALFIYICIDRKSHMIFPLPLLVLSVNHVRYILGLLSANECYSVVVVYTYRLVTLY